MASAPRAAQRRAPRSDRVNTCGSCGVLQELIIDWRHHEEDVGAFRARAIGLQTGGTARGADARASGGFRRGRRRTRWTGSNGPVRSRARLAETAFTAAGPREMDVRRGAG